MSQFFYWLIWIGLGLFVLGWLIKPFLMFVVVPIRTHGKSNRDPHRKHEVADLQKMSPEARQQLEMVLAQFREEGFEPIGPPLASRTDAGISSVHTVVVNSAGDIGEIFSTASQKEVFIRTQTFVVRSNFSDGKQVVTASTRSPGIYPNNPAVDGVNFGWVKDAYTLCEAHRRRMERLGFTHRPRIAPKPGEHETYLREQSENELKRIAGHGYYYFDATAGVYRQTWKGAFLMAWKMISPIKDWRVRRRDRQAQQIWRELKMDQWRLQVPAASAAETPQDSSVLAAPQMEYEPQLAEGEVHTHAADGVLTVRIGMETRGHFLSRQWYQYFAIVVLFMAIALSTYLRWLYGRGRPLPARAAFFYYGWWIILVWTVASLILGLLRRRGTVVLIASQHGLAYRNILALRSEGQIGREQIRALHVLFHRYTLRGRTYQLLLRGDMSPHRVLALGKDKKELERVRDMLTAAMGVKEQADSPAPA